ncbi:MAG: 1-deoxy-D-xylulose-5-phosphate synthase [Absicoccus porci]|uniref:1-deoxy-D-xylulose-5-phosphate synthase n=1 Tax=Absicoccus porci TaxID=2486576 RepID=UPI0023F42567|nr:1-deoxy-D-xylulose-5-phosphate synthase [Absicoccus porci]MDD7330858.1 1-deoxy-D-xylulose-5-phosphate synthase [Absicoccus porci]
MNTNNIQSLSLDELEKLAASIRAFLIQSISQTGGHLSSNLGVVELTIALHYVFHSPQDQMIFDVGHQSYTHKILTGRMDQFSTLRQKDGLSGFQKRKESIHDPWEAGHSSTSLSAALGLAIARDMQHKDHQVIAIIGDGALSGGMAFEALQDIGSKQRKMIIVCNDNRMSISENNAGFERGFLDRSLFASCGLDYVGPLNGHDLKALIQTFESIKDHQGPIVVHVLTQKGKGYPLAEIDMEGNWHGVGPFDVASGKMKKSGYSWSALMADALMELAQTNEKIVAITPAMAQGSKLYGFQKAFPDRFFDCGIAEQHAITMASAMAQGGIRPFVSVYSSFLQRAFDSLLHDASRMDLPIVIGVDRAGLVGADGETHQGVFDIRMMEMMPHMILSQPKDGKEARNLLYTAFLQKHPFAIRYPRGGVEKTDTAFERIPIGSWTKKIVGSHPFCIVITYGPKVDVLIQKAKEEKLSLVVVNARFFKPVDEKMLAALDQMDLPILVWETDQIGSLSDVIRRTIWKPITVIGIGDHFVEQGDIPSLEKEEHIDVDTVIRVVKKRKTSIL